MDKPVLNVAVGLVFSQNKILIGQRVKRDDYFQKWEFPGGKLEEGESVEQALARELREEVGIEIHSSQPFMYLEHDYTDRYVRLHVLSVNDFSGDVQPREGQALKWVDIVDLPEIDFLAGNTVIVEKLMNTDKS